MKKYFIILMACICCCLLGTAQSIGIGTASPDASAQLDISHTAKGLLIPRMSTANIASINSAAKGLMVYDSSRNQLMVNMGTAVSPEWQTIVFKSGWSLGGNNTIDPVVHFIGTTNFAALKFKVNNQTAGEIKPGTGGNTSVGWETILNSTGIYNTAFGNQALRANTSGQYNVANGYEALLSNTTGTGNIAVGASALRTSTTGQQNIAIGSSALRSNVIGHFNLAIGAGALSFNTASDNIALGYQALYTNQFGKENTAIGNLALYANTADRNVAVGNWALAANTSGYGNVATGYVALSQNTTGTYNVATGFAALNLNTTGGYNLAYGNNALYLNTTGSYNVAFGSESMFNNTIGHSNTAHGYQALYYNVNGIRNTAIGYTAGNNSGTNPSNFTAIGYNAGHLGSNSNTIEIGNSSVSWIGGNVGWSTYFSDARAKTDINENVPGLDFITRLRPVTYRLSLQKQNEVLGLKDSANWEGKYDIEQQTQSGFVAQEVDQAAKELNYDFNGVSAPKGNRKLYSMQYAAFVVPLVKAVQEQQQFIQQQKDEIEALKKRLEKMEKLIYK